MFLLRHLRFGVVLLIMLALACGGTQQKPAEPATWTFSFTGAMNSARAGHTATLLESGKVLVAGGNPGSNPLESAELYDPVTGSFNPTGPMTIARQDHVAVRLRDGRVLVLGGATPTEEGRTAVAELYDPVSGTFTTTGSMQVARQSAAAVLLKDGTVLVLGGTWSDATLAEVYDPIQKQFHTVGPMSFGRVAFSAIRLAGNEVLVSGGIDVDTGQELARCEVFDPQSQSFKPMPALQKSMSYHSTSLMADGRVLVLSGDGQDGPFSTAAGTEIYVPASNAFITMSNPLATQWFHKAISLPSGGVLIVGGISAVASGSGGIYQTPTDAAQLFEPSGNTFRRIEPMKRPRVGFAATLLSDGRVLITGGFNNVLWEPSYSSAELWQPGNP